MLKEKDVKITFVIPAYNSEKTIIRCLDSIFFLPIKESFFEVIVIDDHSTDNTVKLVEHYSSYHPNLILLCQQENHRQGAARNRGVEIAQGDYVVFVDSDDESSEGVLSAVKLAEERKLDMVVMSYERMFNNGKVEGQARLPYDRIRVFDGVEMQTKFPFWNTGPCAYVFRKTFLRKVNYPFAEDVLFEDSDFVNVHLFHAKRMSYCDNCGYVVHDNLDSTTHSISSKHLADYALLGTRMLRFYEGLEDKTTKYARGILEGGSYNIMKAFRKIPRLKSCSAVKAFYDRFDAYYDRKSLFGYREPSYCWTRWTRFCLKHRGMTIAITGVAIPLLRVKDKNELFIVQ